MPTPPPREDLNRLGPALIEAGAGSDTICAELCAHPQFQEELTRVIRAMRGHSSPRRGLTQQDDEIRSDLLYQFLRLCRTHPDLGYRPDRTGPEGFVGYLRGLLKALARHVYSRRARQLRRRLQHIGEVPFDESRAAATPAERKHREIEARKEIISLVTDLAAEKSHEARNAAEVLLLCGKRLSDQEIATQLGITEYQVGQRKAWGIRWMKRRFR